MDIVEKLNTTSLKIVLYATLAIVSFCYHDAISASKTPASSSSKKNSSTKIPSPANQDDTTSNISSNPAAVEETPGTGAAQRYIQKKLGIKNNYGFNFSGAWLFDPDVLFTAGVPGAERLTGNSLFLLNLAWDPQQLTRLKGAMFDIEFLQLNAQDTNGQAGTVQGYNSLPGPPPLVRGELYQLWYRQKLFDDKFIFRIGKLVPTIDFNNVIKPVPIDRLTLFIPAVTGLIYTPIFINPSLLGVAPGYYNSAYGVVMSFLPVKSTYITYGIYDGSLAQGKQTGLEGPHFNGTSFQIGEAGVSWLIKNHPGTIAVGAWRQTGPVVASPTLSERGASGVYSFGAQRIWYKNPSVNNSGISVFYQYGINNSNVMPMTQYVGFGVTAFGLLFNREDDSMGFGTANSWLNQNIFSQRTESMFQLYYQAKVIDGFYLEPVLSYIPNPGAMPNLRRAWAGTLRALVLF